MKRKIESDQGIQLFIYQYHTKHDDTHIYFKMLMDSLSKFKRSGYYLECKQNSVQSDKYSKVLNLYNHISKLFQIYSFHVSSLYRPIQLLEFWNNHNPTK